MYVCTSSSSSDLITLHTSRLSSSDLFCAHKLDVGIVFPFTHALFM